MESEKIKLLNEIAQNGLSICSSQGVLGDEMVKTTVGTYRKWKKTINKFEQA